MLMEVDEVTRNPKSFSRGGSTKLRGAKKISTVSPLSRDEAFLLKKINTVCEISHRVKKKKKSEISQNELDKCSVYSHKCKESASERASKQRLCLAVCR